MRIVYVVSDIAPLCCFEDETASRAYAGMFEHYTVTPCLLAGAYESLDIAEAAEAAREGIFDSDVIRNIADDGAMLLRKEGVEYV